MTEYEKKREEEAKRKRRESCGEAADEWEKLHAWYIEYRQRRPKKKKKQEEDTGQRNGKRKGN